MTTTTNLSEFGARERLMAENLLKAWREQGLPEDFYEDEVTIMMNTSSGNVFLTNEDCQVAMLNGDTLESFYYTPYSGHEGFLEDLIESLDNERWEQEDLEYLLDSPAISESQKERIQTMIDEEINLAVI